MSGALLDRLREKGLVPRVLSFDAGEIIFRQGEPGISVFFLLAGKVALTVTGSDGRPIGLTVLGPGGFFGELALISGERYVTAHALTPVQVALVRADETTELARRDPVLLRELLGLIGDRLQRSVDHLARFVSAPLDARLAAVLLDVGAPDQASETATVSMTQADLASLVGASREAVNRKLRKLARRGWLALARGRIILLRPSELAALAARGGIVEPLGPRAA